MPRMPGFAMPYVEAGRAASRAFSSSLGINRGSIRESANRGFATVGVAMGTRRVAGSDDIAYYNRLVRRGKMGVGGGAIGVSAGVMGLRGRSSGGTGQVPSQNMPMY